MTNSVDFIQLINRCGHGIAHSQIEEINPVLCLRKMAATTGNEVSLSENIQPFVSTTIAWDNTDRLEETFLGTGTSHRVTGIAVQARYFGPNLPPQPKTDLSKTKKRSISSLVRTEIPPYNAGEHRGLRARAYVEVTHAQVTADARRKNLVWVLVRRHGQEKQKASGWTGFNISVREGVEVTQDNIGYLPTINSRATDMSTVQEVLVQSLSIKDTLKLNCLVLVFDQALHAKATEI